MFIYFRDRKIFIIIIKDLFFKNYILKFIFMILFFVELFLDVLVIILCIL